MRNLSSEDRSLLSAELRRLTEEHENALKFAVYLSMTHEEHLLFEERRSRIKELREMLAQSKAS